MRWQANIDLTSRVGSKYFIFFCSVQEEDTIIESETFTVLQCNTVYWKINWSIWSSSGHSRDLIRSVICRIASSYDLLWCRFPLSSLVTSTRTLLSIFNCIIFTTSWNSCQSYQYSVIQYCLEAYRLARIITYFDQSKVEPWPSNWSASICLA